MDYENAMNLTGESVLPWKETVYKKIFMEPGGKRLRISLSEHFSKAGLNQDQLNNWLAEINELILKSGLSKHFPKIEISNNTKSHSSFLKNLLTGKVLGVIQKLPDMN